MSNTEPIKIERRGGRREGAGRKKNPDGIIRVQLSALIPRDLLQAVNAAAIREGISRSEFLTRALYKFLGQHPL